MLYNVSVQKWILTVVLSQETTYSQARKNLASFLDQVVEERQILIIKRRNCKNVALIAEDELSSLLESVYLLRSPENAKRLWRALAWAESADATLQTLEELTAELGIES
jgi:antitoxin YefM